MFKFEFVEFVEKVKGIEGFNEYECGVVCVFDCLIRISKLFLFEFFREMSEVMS